MCPNGCGIRRWGLGILPDDTEGRTSVILRDPLRPPLSDPARCLFEEPAITGAQGAVGARKRNVFYEWVKCQNKKLVNLTTLKFFIYTGFTFLPFQRDFSRIPGVCCI